ncbi:hypothetical protein Pcinc_015193 [Petrolisthes cinctipes]|uniref:Uncharacterized protein n=1 Tax=Petrolisthes cinctipes TaxID=88211 RepID=A0AAE1KQ06_PETCI|nr:hypothetical protein Pcinc_015193 [Petrolisthes cinctipes]
MVSRVVLVVCVVLVSVVAMSEAKPQAGCRYTCKDPQGKVYCCRFGDDEIITPTGPKPGTCPPPRISCPEFQRGSFNPTDYESCVSVLPCPGLMFCPSLPWSYVLSLPALVLCSVPPCPGLMFCPSLSWSHALSLPALVLCSVPPCPGLMFCPSLPWSYVLSLPALVSCSVPACPGLIP